MAPEPGLGPQTSLIYEENIGFYSVGKDYPPWLGDYICEHPHRILLANLLTVRARHPVRHASRLDHKASLSRSSSERYSKEELIPELGAAFLATEAGTPSSGPCRRQQMFCEAPTNGELDPRHVKCQALL
jgi:hypothetical protein